MLKSLGQGSSWTLPDIAGRKQVRLPSSPSYSQPETYRIKALKTNNMSIVFHSFQRAGAKAAAISVSLEIILRGFLVDALRCCSQLVVFSFPA